MPDINRMRSWVAEVDRLMKRDWCIDTADAGLSDGELKRYWRDGDTPSVFVAWFAEKYDLIRYEPASFRMRPSNFRPPA